VHKFVLVVAVEDGNRAGMGRVGSLKGRAPFSPFEKEPERRTIGSFESDALTSDLAPAIERNRLPF
jgi:hypothetical protein